MEVLMLTVGDRFPEFKLRSVVSLEKGREFEELTETSHPDKWLVVFSWPMDFTFVCPTEIAEFGARDRDFKERGAQVLGATACVYIRCPGRCASGRRRAMSVRARVVARTGRTGRSAIRTQFEHPSELASDEGRQRGGWPIATETTNSTRNSAITNRSAARSRGCVDCTSAVSPTPTMAVGLRSW